MVIAILGLILVITVILAVRKMEIKQRKTPQQYLAEQWQEHNKKRFQ
jgi:hypothetical protein